jgi:hypothetical protein
MIWLNVGLSVMNVILAYENPGTPVSYVNAFSAGACAAFAFAAWTERHFEKRLPKDIQLIFTRE